jgi:hypothetical protein
VRFRTVVARVLLRDAMAHQMQHLRLERLVHAPELVVGNGVDAFPAAAIGDALGPTRTEEAVEEFVPLAREECRHVHAIGDVGDGVVVRLDLRPQGGKNMCRDTAMDA